MTGPRAVVAGPADWPAIAALRTRVFVEEQGVPPEIERDAADAAALHVLSRDDARRVVATGRLLVQGATATIGRMAAAAEVRGRGHGGAVLDELHWQAVLRGVTAVELHAQLTARRFYERAGYTAVGGEYREAGIPHVTMRRRLPVLRPAGAREADRLLGYAAVEDRRWVLSDGGDVVAAVAAVEGETSGIGVAVSGCGWGPRLARAALSWTLGRPHMGHPPPPRGGQM